MSTIADRAERDRDGILSVRWGACLEALAKAGVSMFAAWNMGTALGATAVHALPDLRWCGVDVVAPRWDGAVLASTPRLDERREWGGIEPWLLRVADR